MIHTFLSHHWKFLSSPKIDSFPQESAEKLLSVPLATVALVALGPRERESEATARRDRGCQGLQESLYSGATAEERPALRWTEGGSKARMTLRC